jgi:hypothetical protein
LLVPKSTPIPRRFLVVGEDDEFKENPG